MRRVASSPASWKHPHVRGEDTIQGIGKAELKETPPRAWGRLERTAHYRSKGGNTPTCVGKTRPASGRRWERGKHPHVRGEDKHGAGEGVAQPETPPRAWGRQPEEIQTRPNDRNTPTCVGKT